MVENTGKTLRADAYKPVNTPTALQVEEDASGFPLAVKGKRRQAITSIEDRWRIDDEWWRAEPVSRLYYNVLLASGQRLVLYKDLIAGGWYEQEY
jgi:phage tail sheath protein FI